jgi:hypothetical protein
MLLLHTDNQYPVGTTVRAVEQPDRILTIIKYHARIYYCQETNEPDAAMRAYFERELIPPALPL